MTETSPVGNTRLQGTVKWFDDTRGFGFIGLDDGSKDAFVHQSEIVMMGRRRLDAGDAVEFDVVIDESGRRRAVGVLKLTAASGW